MFKELRIHIRQCIGLMNMAASWLGGQRGGLWGGGKDWGGSSSQGHVRAQKSEPGASWATVWGHMHEFYGAACRGTGADLRQLKAWT